MYLGDLYGFLWSRAGPRSHWRLRKRQLRYLLLVWSWVLVVGTGRGVAEDPPKVSPQGGTESVMDLTLDQLLEVNVETVYGASKYEQRITQAPASVTIVTEDEIKKEGYRTLAEVLRSVRGLYVTGDRAYSYLGIRGFGRPSDYNSRVLVLIDGHRVNDNIFDGALLGTESILDVDLVDRVEVIRGASSSIYGDNAFFGVINVLTRPGPRFNGLEASAQAGEFDAFGGRLSYGKLFTNGVELVLSGSYLESAGERRLFYREFNDPTSNNGVAENSDEDYSAKVSGHIAYGGFTLSGAWSKRTKNIPTASYDTLFNDGHELATDEYAYGDLKYQHDFSPEVTLLAKVYYDFYGFDGDFPFNAAAPGAPIDRVLHRVTDRGEWAGTDWQLTAEPWEQLKVVGGVAFRRDLRQEQVSYDVNPRTIYTRTDTTSWNLGLYAQADFSVLTNLLLSGGLRYDYYETFGGTVNPRLAAIYSPWHPTTLKLLYGQAYRAPNLSETAHGPLEPETIRTYELDWEQELPRHLRFTVAGYRYEVRNLISETSGVFENVGRVNANGLEFELEGRYGRGFNARISYALQKAEDDDTGEELSNSPRHLAKAALIAPLYADKLFAGFELQYYGDVSSRSGRSLDDYALVNFTLFSRELIRGLEISGSVYNIFDVHAEHAVSAAHLQDSIAQPGRDFRIKLTYRF